MSESVLRHLAEDRGDDLLAHLVPIVETGVDAAARAANAGPADWSVAFDRGQQDTARSRLHVTRGWRFAGHASSSLAVPSADLPGAAHRHPALSAPRSLRPILLSFA